MSVKSFRSVAFRPQLPCHEPTRGWPSWADGAETASAKQARKHRLRNVRRIDPPQMAVPSPGSRGQVFDEFTLFIRLRQPGCYETAVNPWDPANRGIRL